MLHEHFEVWIVNARHLAQVPGRKTDESDAAWITKLMSGLLERSFIPDVEQRDLRDLTRYRTRLCKRRVRQSIACIRCWKMPTSSWDRWSRASKVYRHAR
ncbi:IS110 family transposase [Chloroflexi bacterium TSY]|nr:IS110 family transposase [Chloroflexi bacterium TSY]